MIDTAQWLTFVVTVSAVVFLPGPGILLTVACGMEHGFGASLRAAAGCLAANASHWVIVAAGLGAVIASYPSLLIGLKYAGACYLVYLGVMIARPQGGAASAPRRGLEPIALRKGMFTRGFVAMFMNPKSFIFFLAILPLFIDPMHNPTAQYLAFGVTFLLLGGSALLSYSYLAVILKGRLGTRISVRIQKALSGILLVIAGLYFALMQVNTQILSQ